MNSDFEQTMGTDLAGIPVMADAVSNWGEREGVSAATIFHVNIVLEELLTNVILHGLGEGGPGGIHVHMVRKSGALELELRDDAPPFDPFQVPPPKLTTDIDEREVGGLGVHFVRTLMDRWQYVREGGLNVVRLTKLLDGASA